MRIRYGKSIKVTNLLASFNNTGTGNSYSHMVAQSDGAFHHNATVNNLRKFSIINGHKYFLCAKSEFALDSFVIMSGASWYNPLFTSDAPTYTDGNSYTTISVNADNNNVGLLIWCRNHNSWNVYNCIIIDLTALGLDNLTALQFYNKYNKYFSFIATGEEITIDSKAGQINLTEFSDNNIHNNIFCSIAGGSSAIYYNYNQLLDLNTTITYTGSNPGRAAYDFVKDTDQVLTLTKKDSAWSGASNTSIFSSVFNNLTQTTDGTKVLCIYKIKNCTTSPFIINHIYNSTTIYDHSSAIPANDTGYYFEILNKIPKVYWGLTWDSSVSLAVGDELLKLYLGECSIINLTEMFGAGKEPTTIAEFRQKFVRNYYGYCATPISLTQYQIEATPVYTYNQFGSALNGYRSFPSERNVATRTYDSATNTLSLKFTGDWTASNQVWYKNEDVKFNAGDKALFIAQVHSTYSVAVGLYYLFDPAYQRTNSSTAGEWSEVYKFGTFLNGKSAYLYAYSSHAFANGDYLDLKDVMIINLTTWYGSGNEPTTIEEFRATFPKIFYPTSAKRYLNHYMINKM